jgi:hypothetical protein
MPAHFLLRQLVLIAGIMLAGGCTGEKGVRPHGCDSPVARRMPQEKWSDPFSSLGDEVPGFFKSQQDSGAVASAEPFKWTMSFKQAVEPYAHEVYNYDGYVNGKGAVVNGGLGCSGFVSVVLHRMRYGDNWQASYDKKLYQEYGDVIAHRSGLPLVCTIDSNSLVAPAKCQAFFASRGVNVGAILIFNVRNGVHGHVGFVRVMPGGWLAQFHYSGMKGYNGLAQGDFTLWYSRSMYKASPVEFYGITNDPPAK